MKNKMLKICSLSAVLLLAGCNNVIKANPTNASDALVTFTDGKEYFQNNYQKVYDVLKDSSDFNSLTFDAVLNKIIEDKVYSKNEITNKSFFQDIDTLKDELIEEDLLKKLDVDTYKTDKLFSEKKFLNSINASLYEISVENPHEDVLIKPDTEVKDLLGDNYLETYKKYIDKEVMPDINKKLLTAKYIIENSFSSLGRAYARKISYVKLENMTKKPGAASQLITKWLGTFVNDHKTTTFTEENGTKEYSFDLDSLARIYKGIASSNTAEQVYFDDAEYYTLSDEITDEIAKIAVDPSHGDYTMKLDIDIDKTIEDKYTSSGTYTLAWGHELALRDLASKKISGNGLFTKTNGISDLPETVSDRLFSSSISSYLTSAYYMKDGSNPYETGEDGKQTLKANAVEVKFLTPATSENGSDLSNYYFFDSTTNAYYIVVVEEYRYTASNLKSVDYKHVTYQGTEESEQTIIGVDNDMARIALELSSSTSYSTEAILKVLEEYEITTNIHDQAFYDYMKENYSKLFD